MSLRQSEGQVGPSSWKSGGTLTPAAVATQSGLTSIFFFSPLEGERKKKTRYLPIDLVNNIHRRERNFMKIMVGVERNRTQEELKNQRFGMSMEGL